MKAALLKGRRDIGVESVPLPAVGPGELLLKVENCFICGSDIRIFNHGNDRVTYPAITGHEISGVVCTVGPGVSRFAEGDRIALGADVPNMEEDWGKQGMGNLCDINYAIGHQFPGGFAEYCLLNEMTVSYGPLEKIPDDMPLELAAFSEPIACCINAFERCQMAPGKSVLVFGAGPMGLLLCLVAEYYSSSTVVLVDPDKERVALAKQCNFDNVFCGTTVDLDEMSKISQELKHGFDVILTACPSPDAHEAAIDLVKKRGVINLFGGLPKSARKIEIVSNAIHYKEAMLTGSHGSTPRQFKEALRIIAAKKAELEAIITHRFPLDHIEKAFAIAEDKKGIKVLIKP